MAKHKQTKPSTHKPSGRNNPLPIDEHPLPKRGTNGTDTPKHDTPSKPSGNSNANPAHAPFDAHNTDILTRQKHGSGGLSPDPERAQHQLDALAQTKWKPGQSGNPSGRPNDFVKGIALRIAQLRANKILTDKEQIKLEKLGIASADITVLESLILDWATSKNPIKQQMYLERIAGKVPNINLNAQMSEELVTRFKSKLTDSELERIAGGEDAFQILLDKLPDADDDDVIDA